MSFPELNHPLLDSYPDVSIGISSGLREEARVEAKTWLPQMLRDATGKLLEVSVMQDAELKALRSFLRSDHAPELLQLPAQLSLHAPSKNLDGFAFDRIIYLSEMPKEFAQIIVHPDVMGDPQSWQMLGQRLVLENMDCRKNLGSTVEDLAAYFQILPKAKFCLDVAHVWSLDKTMQLGFELLEAFSNRLVEVHFSGIKESGSHCPLSKEQFATYQPLLEKVRNTPWILESSWA